VYAILAITAPTERWVPSFKVDGTCWPYSRQ
jgi:hypothetical protein